MDEFTFLIKRGIDIIEVETDTIFSEKLENITTLSTSIVRANGESKRKSRIITKSWANQKNKVVETNTALKRSTPHWLEIVNDRYVLKTKEVEIIKYIFNQYIDGRGVTNIVRDINNQNESTDHKWNFNIIHHILRDKRLIGWLHGKKRKIETGERDADGKKILVDESEEDRNARAIKIYPEIIELELFNLVQRSLKSNTLSNKRRTTPVQRSLFNGLSRCGVCNDVMIGHFTLRGNYLRCLTKRANPDACNNGLIRYEDTERSILNHIKGLDLSTIYRKGENILDTVRIQSLKNELTILTSEVEDILVELKSADEDEVLPLVKLRKAKRNKLDFLSEELSSLIYRKTPEKIDQSFDIIEIQKQENIELRQETNFQIKKLVNTIHIQQTNYEKEPFYILRFEYHNSVLCHYLLTTRKGDKLAECHVEMDDEVILVMSFLKVNASTGEVKIDRLPNKYEEMLWEHMKAVLEASFEIAIKHLEGIKLF